MEKIRCNGDKMKETTKQNIKEFVQMLLISILCTSFVLSVHSGRKNKSETKPTKTEVVNKIVSDSIKSHVR